jgi:hypothetical protein
VKVPGRHADFGQPEQGAGIACRATPRPRRRTPRKRAESLTPAAGRGKMGAYCVLPPSLARGRRMSTDITRGPKVCPSCGKENPPTAARCALCATPLNGAFQTTPAPAWREVCPPLDPDAEPNRQLAARGCTIIAVEVGVALLVTVSAFVTFFTVCASTTFAYVSISPPNGSVGLFLGVILGILAAALVASLVAIFFHRPRQR